MDSVSQNGILKEEEFGRFKERTVKLRFMQQISYGLGAAMVFGLFTAIASKLVPLAIGGVGVTASAPAMLALGGIAALGIGLIYLSAKFLSENVLLEQDFQAKKIGAATRAVAVEPQVGITGKPIQFPAQSQSSAAREAVDMANDLADSAPTAPTLVVNNSRYDGRMDSSMQAKERAGW